LIKIKSHKIQTIASCGGGLRGRPVSVAAAGTAGGRGRGGGVLRGGGMLNTF
jgi:hypothetical protein